MAAKAKKDKIETWVEEAFSDLGPDGNDTIQNYISILINKIEQLENSIQHSILGIFVALFLFIFIKDGALAEMELLGIKIVKLEFILSGTEKFFSKNVKSFFACSYSVAGHQE